jgi:hypothetical protein
MRTAHSRYSLGRQKSFRLFGLQLNLVRCAMAEDPSVSAQRLPSNRRLPNQYNSFDEHAVGASLDARMPRPIAAKACAGLQLKVASTRRERQSAFELVYNSYRRAGLCAKNQYGLRVTPYQLLETTDIIVAELEGEIISTMSLVRDGELGLPMEAIFPEIVRSRRMAGVRPAEVSCLADRRRNITRFYELFCELCRVMAQLAARTDVDELLICVHPRHAPIYHRHMAFEQIGPCRDYPTFCGKPAVALSLNFAFAQQNSPTSWERFFGSPLPSDVLVSARICEDDRAYFQALMEESNRGGESHRATTGPSAAEAQEL